MRFLLAVKVDCLPVSSTGLSLAGAIVKTRLEPPLWLDPLGALLLFSSYRFPELLSLWLQHLICPAHVIR